MRSQHRLFPEQNGSSSACAGLRGRCSAPTSTMLSRTRAHSESHLMAATLGSKRRKVLAMWWWMEQQRLLACFVGLVITTMVIASGSEELSEEEWSMSDG